MKQYPVNSINDIDKVIIVAKYRDKWVLCHNNIYMHSCLTGISSGDALVAAMQVIESYGLTATEIIPLWDHEEDGFYRVFYADVEAVKEHADLILLEAISKDMNCAEIVYMAEVIVTSNRLLSFVDSLKDVRSCVVRGKKNIGTINEMSSFELILDVNEPRAFAFKLPDLLSGQFYTSLQAYRVFPDKFVLNIIFSKINPLFVVRFSVMK